MNDTTLGAEIFRSRNISDIRQALERKALTCLIHGQRNEFFPAAVQLTNRHLRNAYHLASISTAADLLTMENAVGDTLRNSFMDGLPSLLTDAPSPTWGADDAELLALVARIHELEKMALGGSRLL